MTSFGPTIADRPSDQVRSPASSEGQSDGADRGHQAILAALPTLTGRTLEISSDEGRLAALLADRATVLVRLDTDPARSQRLAAHGNIRVRPGSIRRRLPMRRYETVVCVGQLEEVPLHEARLVRERLVRSLTAGGILVLQHGPSADTLHPPFLDHGLETISVEVLEGTETLVLRRRRARALADARWLLGDLVREPWPAPAPPSHRTDAEAHVDTGQVVEEPAVASTNGAARYNRRLLLRVDDRPAGVVNAAAPLPSRHVLTNALVSPVAGDLAPRLRTTPRTRGEIIDELERGRRPPRHPLTSVPRPLEQGELVVAICTTRSPEVSARLVSELAGAFDVVVLENGTDQPRLAAMCAAAGVAYEHDPRPGLAAARNRAVAGVDARWVLFLDDDCRLRSGGAPELARRLGGAIDQVPDAGAIGGLVLPASIDCGAEEDFERVAGHGRGFLPVRYDAHSSPDRWWPLRHGDWMAVGACLAVRQRAWAAVGGFDERLGAGTRAASAEDDAFLQAVVEGGWSVFYDPAVVVRHQHRVNRSALRQQLFGYGLGRSVNVLLKAIDHRNWEILSLWAALLAEDWRDERSRPLQLGGAELLGYLAGPIVALQTAYASRQRKSIGRPW